MQGLEGIIHDNKHAESQRKLVIGLPIEARDEYNALLNSIDQNYELGLITQAQRIEEYAEARNTYLG